MRERNFGDMPLVFIGTDFSDSTLVSLERLQLGAEQFQRRLTTDESPILGAVVLATCNRFEAYFDAPEFHGSLEFAVREIAKVLEIEEEEVTSKFRVLYGPALTRHIYSVAAGLESMVVGEAEITGQVKRALSGAQNEGLVTAELQKLFQSASGVAKKVISETGLGASGRSVISVALEIAQTRLGQLDGKSALIIGTGAYARVTVAALKRAGVGRIFIYSKSGRAKAFSTSHEVEPVGEASLLEVLAEVTLVVGASGTPGHVIDLPVAEKLQQLRRSELVLVDVALSKDVAPEVAALEKFFVIDLEQLKLLAPKQHSESVAAAEQIVSHAVSNFEAALSTRKMDPVISALRAHVNLWVDAEVELVRKKQGDDVAREVERSLNRVTKAILHTPTVKAKDVAKDGNHEDYLRAIRLLFDLELGKDA